MNNLEKALNRFLSHSQFAGPLARVLAYASKKGRLSYYEVERVVNDDTEA